jgi:hypothetical protein
MLISLLMLARTNAPAHAKLTPEIVIQAAKFNQEGESENRPSIRQLAGNQISTTYESSAF